MRPAGRRAGGWRRVALACAVLVPGLAGQEPDAVLVAARKALAAGQPVAALQLLEGHPAQDGPTAVRLLQAQGLLALGRAQEAAACLHLGDRSQLAAWPETLRGGAAAVAGGIALAGGDLVLAAGWLEQALRAGGEGVEVDRTAVLLAECAERRQDLPTALRYAHLVWRDWPRSPYRARAGLIAARITALQEPDQARAILAGVRAIDHVEPGTRGAAVELLCQLLLPVKPGQCLVVAEQELARATDPGRLPLYRALALAVLAPDEGLAAFERLPPALRELPAARAAELKLRNPPADRQPDAALRIERARVELELGRPQPARQILEPLAADEPAALALLAGIEGVDLAPWLASAAMGDAAARTAVAIALARRGDHARAWPLFDTLVTPPARPGAGAMQPSLLFWAAESAAAVRPERRAGLLAQLLALPGEGVEVGMAWAAEAERRGRAGAQQGEVQAAWERAAGALPAGHPWQAPSVLQAVRPLLEAGTGAGRARILLERVPLGGSEDQRRCRFLLAQAYERLGLPVEALRAVAELRPAASAEQAAKLDRLQIRLDEAAASEVRKGPLDAEN